MYRLFPAIAILVLSALPAMAHTGHLMDNGSGHEHITGYITLGFALGIATAVTGIAFFRRACIHARRRT